jgi:hypothetical protein
MVRDENRAMESGNRIPVLVCIDVEPDGFLIDRNRPDPWRGFERAVEFFNSFRSKADAALASSIRFTWCFRMDPQVEDTYGSPEWAVRHYGTLASALVASGDDMGLHLHAYRWDRGHASWVIDHGSQAWIDHCLHGAFEAFERAFGRRCATFRFGDRWLSNATVRLLETLGVLYDLTLEPGWEAQPTNHRHARSTGQLPDYSEVPRAPYRPAVHDYRRPDASRETGIWMIPLSTAPVRPRLLRRLYYRLRQPGRRPAPWTALLSHEPLLFRRIVDQALQQGPDTYLAMALRSNAMAEPRLARRVSANLHTLLAHPRAEDFAWTTAEDAIRLLRPGSPARLPKSPDGPSSLLPE